MEPYIWECNSEKKKTKPKQVEIEINEKKLTSKLDLYTSLNECCKLPSEPSPELFDFWRALRVFFIALIRGEFSILMREFFFSENEHRKISANVIWSPKKRQWRRQQQQKKKRKKTPTARTKNTFRWSSHCATTTRCHWRIGLGLSEWRIGLRGERRRNRLRSRSRPRQRGA
jgi:hypothetical protein